MESKKDNIPPQSDDSDTQAGSVDETASLAEMERLFAQFRTPLEKYFKKRVYNVGEVDDLVQDVFYRLTKQANPLNLDRPEAYIFQIAANLLRDKARKEITRRASTKQLFDQNKNNFEEISPERVLLGKQNLAALKNALNELPERTRVIILLHRFEELKYREIASRLGISVSSVEKHMMDGIKHLTYRLGRSG